MAAVASYLDAHANGGEWLVRIDDLDRPRTVTGAADGILRTLDAYGMQWHASVVYQSRRSDAYHAALHALRRQGKLYACACSRREIADSALAGPEGFVYPGTCRARLPPDRSARAWRVSTEGAAIVLEDTIQGRLEQDLQRAVGDFVLYRADGIYAYQLAVSVDDAEQGVTHIVRGADLLESTPRQIYLQRLLGLPTPSYAHVPVALNERGEKLSKQTLARAVDRSGIGATLTRTLRFLGHPPPAELASAPPAALWQWAKESWNIARVPRTRTLPADST